MNDRAGTGMRAAWLLPRVSCVSLKAGVGIRIGLGQAAFRASPSAVAAAPGDSCLPRAPPTGCWVGVGEAVRPSAHRLFEASPQVCRAGHVSPAPRAVLTGLPGPCDGSVGPLPCPARFPFRSGGRPSWASARPRRASGSSWGRSDFERPEGGSRLRLEWLLLQECPSLARGQSGSPDSGPAGLGPHLAVPDRCRATCRAACWG